MFNLESKAKKSLLNQLFSMIKNKKTEKNLKMLEIVKTLKGDWLVMAISQLIWKVVEKRFLPKNQENFAKKKLLSLVQMTKNK